jgi:hypothetical protein
MVVFSGRSLMHIQAGCLALAQFAATGAAGAACHTIYTFEDATNEAGPDAKLVALIAKSERSAQPAKEGKREKSSSFLKKRTKKLLFVACYSESSGDVGSDGQCAKVSCWPLSASAMPAALDS